MSDEYFARRLVEELKLAERAGDEQERAVRLRACYLLCSLLGFTIGRAAEERRVARQRARAQVRLR